MVIPTSDTIFGWVVLAAALLVLVAAVICFWWNWIRRGDSDNYGGSLIVGWILLVIGLLIPIGPLVGFGMVGYSPDYLFYNHVEGTVTQIASRQISDGSHGMSTRYVVTLQDGQPYAIDDARAALLKDGDHVSLMCTKEFQWGSTNNGYACNWG